MFKVSVHRRLLIERRIQEDKNALVRALKNDDADAAKKALTGMSGNDLSLTHDKFTDLLHDIDKSTKPETSAGARKHFMDDARFILGVGKNTSQTTQTHNPVTGQPWTSGPVAGTITPEEADELYDIIMTSGPDDIRRDYPNLNFIANKIKKSQSLNSISQGQEEEFVSFYKELITSHDVSSTTKDRFQSIINKLVSKG